MPERKLLPKIHIGKFVDPLSDFGFKLLFATEPNKDLLIAFLNELFEGRKYITDLTYNKNENHGPQNDYRTTVYDLTCTGKDGEQFIIEVQRMQQYFFKDRAIYYTSTLIHDQGPRGEKKWNFQLKEVYLIGVMNFCFEDTPSASCLHRIHLTYESTGQVFYNKLGYIFIEIPKFNKAEHELQTDLDRWLFVLKNMHKLEKIPLYLTKRIFEKLFTIAAVAKLSREEFMNYERSLMEEWDKYAVLETAENKGFNKGKEEGIIEGQEEKSIQFVQNLLAAGKFTTIEIANYAGVTEAFVLEVKKNRQ